MSSIDQLLDKYPIISDQVTRQELRIILSELEHQLKGNLQAVVEFGCYAGTTSLFIQRLLIEQESSAVFHVYDSFEGLPEKVSHDLSPAGEQFTAGKLSVSKKTFLMNFRQSHLQPPIIHKGWFTDVADTDVPEEIGFAFLDGDYYESIRDSLRAIERKLARNATIIVDDYANEALPGAAKALDEWCRNRGIGIYKVTASLAIVRISG